MSERAVYLQGFQLPSDLGRSVLHGEVLVRDPVNFFQANLPSASTDRVCGVVYEKDGGDAGQTLPLTLLRHGEHNVRIQDNATVALYDLLEPSPTDAGAARTSTSGQGFAIALEAITVGAADQYVKASIFAELPLAAIAGGTAATGVTADETAAGPYHRTTLAVSTTLPAIAGGAALGVGKLLYTFPAGVIAVHSSHMSLALTQSEGNITADTPDGGLGTVIASGVISVLSGTGTFENLLTGQTFNDCNGTAETIALAPTAGSPLILNAADPHTVYFNVADTWAAGGDVAAGLAGTVVLLWSKLT